jgi:hypothetical protein
MPRKIKRGQKKEQPEQHSQAQFSSSWSRLPVPSWSNLHNGLTVAQEGAETAKEDTAAATSSYYMAFQDDCGEAKANEEFAKAYSQAVEHDDSDSSTDSLNNNKPKRRQEESMAVIEQYGNADQPFLPHRGRGLKKSSIQAKGSADKKGPRLDDINKEFHTKHQEHASDDSSSNSDSSSGSTEDDEEAERESRQLDRLGKLLSKEWHDKYGNASKSPDFSRRLVNFKYAQQKRKETFGTGSNGDDTSNTPFGIFGVYEQLADIRNDIKWADEVERRKDEGEP